LRFSRDNDIWDDEEEDYPETIQPEYIQNYQLSMQMEKLPVA